jgi:alanine racemase
MVGRVSMDMITVDVTAHPDIAHRRRGRVCGVKILPADTVAQHASTISYELFCRLTSRVRFEYVH